MFDRALSEIDRDGQRYVLCRHQKKGYRRAAQAADTMGHYYVLQTNLSSQKADSGQIQQYYKSLMMVERSFRIAKTCLEIRPIRHWKKKRITGHIYLNYLCLWLVRYIEKHWRSLEYSGEVTSALRRWDDMLRYTELIDDEHQASVGFQWNQGKQARRAIEEIDQLGVRDKIHPQL